MSALYKFKINSVKGRPLDLEALFKGKVVLIFNSASGCSFTPQLKGFQELYKELKDSGFEILGCPSNDFNQEEGEGQKISDFCSINYGVTFTMSEKISLNGDNEHPLYQFLKNSKAGILGLKRIKWNFEKFLIDKNGDVVSRYSSIMTPEAIKSDILKLLANGKL